MEWEAILPKINADPQHNVKAEFAGDTIWVPSKKAEPQLLPAFLDVKRGLASLALYTLHTSGMAGRLWRIHLDCPHWKINETTSDSNPQSSCCLRSVLTFLRHTFSNGGIETDYGIV